MDEVAQVEQTWDSQIVYERLKNSRNSTAHGESKTKLYAL
jgi:hypothetical protein